MSKKILITSALPYANGPLHFGHIAGAYLPGDCYARFQRLRNREVLYICGSDEYGVAITLKAEMDGRGPKEHVDIYHEINRGLFEKLNFSFDHYSRTTWEGHKIPTIQFFEDLLEGGYIEPRITNQLFSEQDQKFLADRYVVGQCPKCSYENARGDECPKCAASYEATDLINPRSKITNASLTLKATKHWFLFFDKFKDQLTEWMAKKHWKSNVLNFAKRYLEDLRPRAITRDSHWGIPVPLEGAVGKVFYVWFDAPIGYISSSMQWAQKLGDPDRWKDFWCDPETKYVQFIGKDNIPFHAIFFPAMILGQKQFYKTVDDLSANEFLNLEGKAFSKSDGWFIDLEDFFQKYTCDQIRFSIAANAPETADTEFKWKDFQMHCNTELLGKYGNLVNRILVFTKKNCDGRIPDALDHLEEEDEQFLDRVHSCVEAISNSYENYKMRKASQQIMELAQIGNVYFDGKKPWKDAKDQQRRERLEATIFSCLHCLKALAIVSFPIIPETANKVWKMLGCEGEIEEQEWGEAIGKRLLPNQLLPKPQVLFRKIEDEEIKEELGKLTGIMKISSSE